MDVDLRPATIRNYVSDLRHFVVWCEQTWSEGQEAVQPFTPAAVATPTLIRYRTFLQETHHLKPASVNRTLISLKRYFAWALVERLIQHNPARVVKLVGRDPPSPRHLSDGEEDALVAAVTTSGTVRDRTMLILLLHTGLRAHELCHLQRTQVVLGQRSGTLSVVGKRNKYREVPLNATARAALQVYLDTLAPDTLYLFPSHRTLGPLTERSLGLVVQKYAARAGVVDVSPHDLRHRFGYRMAERVALHRLAQIMGHDSLDTTLLYIRGTKRDLQRDVEKIAWT
jgi:integrase/recombinase XerC